MAEYEGSHDKQALQLTAAITDYQYQGTVRVQHFVDTILEHATPEQISEKVKRPLEGLKVACYYGCLITHPAQATGADNPEYPMQMDTLLQSLGAESVDWSFKTDCCGGSLSVTQTEQSLNMSEAILKDAKACGAEAVITMCPGR